MTTSRRTFCAAGALATAGSYQRVLGANGRIRVAGLGCGGRANHLLALLRDTGEADITAVCDVYGPRRGAAREKFGPGAKEYVDYRQVLERRDIDAVVIGSPDHWHVPMTIDAIQAGKDVYVEKPVSHTIEEGDALLKAAAASKQIIQVGYQQRSWPHFQQARQIIAAGKLGKVTLVLASWYQNYVENDRNRMSLNEAELDWKRWLGSAPGQPVRPERYFRWRWFWDFGGGHLTDLYSHWTDTIHWLLGVSAPRTAQAMGGRYVIDYMECPDTVNAAWEYPGDFAIVYNGTLHCHLDGGNIIFRGRNALMKLNRDGFAVYPEGVVPREKTIYPEPEISMRSLRDGAVDHVRNFLDSMRSRATPNSSVTEAVAAANAAHFGNLALRQGVRLKWEDVRRA